MYPLVPRTGYKPSMAVICSLECSLVFHVLDTSQVWPSFLFLNIPPWSKYWIQAKYGRHFYSWIYPRGPSTGYKPSMAVISILEYIYPRGPSTGYMPSMAVISILEYTPVVHVLDTSQVWPSSVFLNVPPCSTYWIQAKYGLSSEFLNVPPCSTYWIQAKYGRHLNSWMYPRVPRTGYKPSMALPQHDVNALLR